MSSVEPTQPPKSPAPGAWREEVWKLLSTGAVAAFAAVIGSVLTYMATTSESARKYQNLDRQLDLTMIDISLAILAGEKGDPKDPDNVGSYYYARDFAIQALSKASGIEVKPEIRDKWAKADPLQFGARPAPLGTSVPMETPIISAPLAPPENANVQEAPAGLAFSDEHRSKLTVCIGQYRQGCPNDIKNHFTCGASVDDIRTRACPKPLNNTVTPIQLYAGNACGYAVYEISCHG